MKPEFPKLSFKAFSARYGDAAALVDLLATKHQLPEEVCQLLNELVILVGIAYDSGETNAKKERNPCA